MARLFDDANSQYMEYNGAVLAAAPISMACWFNTDDLTVLEMLMSINGVPSGPTGTHTFCLYVDGTAAGDPIRAGTQHNTFAAASSSAGPSINTWAHACGVWSATNARAAYLNGGNKGTNATDLVPNDFTKTNIGCYYTWTTSAVRFKFFSGLIAEAGIWDIALTDAEVAALATGLSPLAVHPANLVAYWPLIGRYSPEVDTVGGYGITLSASAPAVAAHPRVLYPSNPLPLKSTYAAPPVGGGQVLAYGKYW